MAASVSTSVTAPDSGAVPAALVNACFVLFVINASFFPAAYFAHWWIYDVNGLGIPTDFVNVWAAGRLVLDGHPAQAYDWDIQKQDRGRAARAGLRRLFRLALSAAVSVRRVPAGAVSLCGRFHRLGGGQPRSVSRCDARDRRPPLRLAAGAGVSGGVQQHAGRAERLSHRGTDRRHALSAAGAADPRRASVSGC